MPLTDSYVNVYGQLPDVFKRIGDAGHCPPPAARWLAFGRFISRGNMNKMLEPHPFTSPLVQRFQASNHIGRPPVSTSTSRPSQGRRRRPRCLTDRKPPMIVLFICIDCRLLSPPKSPSIPHLPKRPMAALHRRRPSPRLTVLLMSSS